jgi:hypothetical protein
MFHHDRSSVVINHAESQRDEDTELVIAQRLLACILARRLDDIHLSETENEGSRKNNEEDRNQNRER